MQRIDASHARWTFTEPIVSVNDDAGFEVAGLSPDASTVEPGNRSVLCTYLGGVAIGNAWLFDAGTVQWTAAIANVAQSGRVI